MHLSLMLMACLGVLSLGRTVGQLQAERNIVPGFLPSFLPSFLPFFLPSLFSLRLSVSLFLCLGRLTGKKAAGVSPGFWPSLMWCFVYIQAARPRKWVIGTLILMIIINHIHRLLTHVRWCLTNEIKNKKIKKTVDSR